MSNFIKVLDILQSDEELLYEFANLTQRDTGISNIVIHCYSQGDKEVQHAPRIKVSNVYGKYAKNDCFSIDLNGKVQEGEVKISSKELSILKLWIALNKKELLNYWKVGTEIGTTDFIRSLKKVKKKDIDKK